jgi:hypothetical protein
MLALLSKFGNDQKADGVRAPRDPQRAATPGRHKTEGSTWKTN